MNWLRFILDPPKVPKGAEKRKEQPTAGVFYDTEWAQRPAARAVREVTVWGFMKPAIKLYGNPQVIGVDRIKDVEGPVVFAANHHSHADTTLLLATIPSRLRRDLAIAAGADYFFPNRVAGAISALFIGAIPIERQRLSRLSIGNTLDAIKSGRNLLVFPEGGRSPDGWGSPHKPGAAFVATKSNVPVVPVYIEGTGTILPKGQRWPSRARAAVVFGAPMERRPDEDAKLFATRIETGIAELADEFAHGWWEARHRAGQGKTKNLGGPGAGAWRRRWALGPKPSQRWADPTVKRWPKF